MLVLLLAFGLGLAATAMSNVAMAAPIQEPAQAGIRSGALCPGCDSNMQRGGLAPSCVAPPAAPSQRCPRKARHWSRTQRLPSRYPPT